MNQATARPEDISKGSIGSRMHQEKEAISSGHATYIAESGRRRPDVASEASLPFEGAPSSNDRRELQRDAVEVRRRCGDGLML